MDMLIGQYTVNLSSGRRVAIPKKFVNELGRKMVITRWYEGCLVLVSIENWKVLLNRLTGEKKFITAPVRDIDRFILGGAYEVEPDGQGRVVVPEALANYATLLSQVVFMGLGDRVEIWGWAQWNKREKIVLKEAAATAEKLTK